MNQEVLCPTCDFNMAHILYSVSFNSKDDYFITEFTLHFEDGNILIELNEPLNTIARVRETSFIHIMKGECGHKFGVGLFFHKGTYTINYTNNTIVETIINKVNEYMETNSKYFKNGWGVDVL
jgi:hypothetical protein